MRNYKRKEHKFEDGVELKFCKQCELWRGLDSFSKASREWDGLQYKCKQCTELYRQENKEHIKKRYQTEKYKDKKIEYMKTYYKENKEDRQKANKESYNKFKDKRLEYSKQYREKNKIQINENRRNKLKTDINFRLAHNLRNRLRIALKENSKYGHTLDMLGCTIEEFKAHLESQFTEGMTWDNYGKWHLDHIQPCASFDLSKDEELKKCAHYTNIQPLWANDNWEKGGH